MINQGSALDRALHHDDMNAVRELLEEIGERGLQKRYTEVLTAPFWHINYGHGPKYEDDWEFQWFLLNATPDQHARAFIATTQERHP